MVSSWSRTITHYDKSAAWASANITPDVLEQPLFTDTAAGQVNSAIINISANRGRYIKTGAGPTKIDKGDRIRIQVTDAVVTTYNSVFEVIKRLPIKTKDGGTILQITCLGIERWLQEVKFIKPFYFSTIKDAFIDMINQYNNEVGVATGMPNCTFGTNELPDKGFHNIDFGVNEESVFDRILQLIDKAGASAANGGVLDFFDVKFTYNSANVINFTIHVLSSGNVAGGKPTVTINSTNVNTGESEAGLEAEEATLIGAWGANDAGSLSTNYSKFKSRQILLPTRNAVDSLFPPFDAGQVPYKQNSIVTATDGFVYKANTDTSTSPPGAAWTQLTPQSYYGGTIQYSLWTDGREAEWKNNGADPTGLKGPYARCMFDGNLVINDATTFRTWADVNATSPAGIDAAWLYNGVTFYEGLRVLVRGTGTGDFTSFSNMVIEYRNGVWVKKYDFTGESGTFLCAVIDEARNYAWSGSSWVDRTAASGVLGSDCFHPYSSLVNSESAIKNADTKLEFTTTNISSSIKVTYDWTPLAVWVQDILPPTINAGYYKSGAWLCFRFPFPKNTNNGSILAVGELYGGNITNGIVPFLDFQNMNQAHNGLRGFNHTNSSEDFGQINALEFIMKLTYTDSADVILPKGNFRMRCWLFDRNDHVVYQDFVMLFNNTWESVSLPVSGFQIYRGHRPRFGGTFTDVLPPKGLDPVESFEWRHVCMVAIATLESYDELGRYHAGLGDFGFFNIFTFTNRRIKLYIDAFRFRKPLFVTSGQVTDIIKTSDFLQRPDIGNYEQLKSDVMAELERARYEKTQYDVTTEGRFNINASDFFLFNDTEIVPFSDTAADTVKLVAKHIDYSITKPVDNKGGFLRTIRGSRRFE